MERTIVSSSAVSIAVGCLCCLDVAGARGGKSTCTGKKIQSGLVRVRILHYTLIH